MTPKRRKRRRTRIPVTEMKIPATEMRIPATGMEIQVPGMRVLATAVGSMDMTTSSRHRVS
jgi:hypothetical protein